ncbi:MAG: phosphoglycerate kinase [Gammaproteobacteria bacterium SG8_11]|nr:MAG: phosphoglycerate kinase [Gammaproteobacteria bacterium SG8_11]
MGDYKTTTIDLMRHGEPVGGRRYRGHKDDPLSETGWQQMREAVAHHKPWDVVISSPLSRCAAFANELAQRHGLSLSFDERLKEISWGDWEGRTPHEIHEKYPDALPRYWSNPHQHVPPRAERIGDFRERIVSAWNDLLAQHSGKHLIIIGHAGVTRVAVCHSLNIPIENMFRTQVAYAAITRIEIEHRGSLSYHKLIHHSGSLD